MDRRENPLLAIGNHLALGILMVYCCVVSVTVLKPRYYCERKELRRGKFSPQSYGKFGIFMKVVDLNLQVLLLGSIT